MYNSLSISDSFPAYTKYDPEVPVWCITPDLQGSIHRFFDTTPVSPSGRYVALTRFLFENRLPELKDTAKIVLIDLESGTGKEIAETSGWDTQTGAQVQWGRTDQELFYNDMDCRTWEPFGIRIDPETGEKNRLDGTVYMISPDGKSALSPCLKRLWITQRGYGVIAPKDHIPKNQGAPADDGIYITDLDSGKQRLLISIEKIVQQAGLKARMPLEKGGYYIFHVKWSPDGNRIFAVIRYKVEKNFFTLMKMGRWTRSIRPQLITMNADGSDVRVAVDENTWVKGGGNHPNWCSDNESISLNLRFSEGRSSSREPHRFVTAKADGSGITTYSEKITGSGHPVMYPGNRFILTDAYPGEPVSFGDKTVPIRWIDLENETETNLIRIRSKPAYEGTQHQRGSSLAWDKSISYIVQAVRTDIVMSLSHTCGRC
ncbi:hypothetical protein QUF76_09875 [Desulfobacterales bacterium HSG16]|nr:hypothetical protein [Desulfobacterales bacterium HSG16]